jgi:hypothetical protein
MKRTLHIGVVLVFLLALVPAGVAAHTEADPLVVNLLAGKTIDAGDVEVWNDGDHLHVEFVAAVGWCITETHLQVAESLDGIPQKNGNPIPGQFDYKMEHDCVAEYTYAIDLGAWSPGTGLYIAAHAVVADTGSMMAITLSSGIGVDVYGPLGSYAPLGDGAWSNPGTAVATWVHGSWPLIGGATWISTAYHVEDPIIDSWRWFHEEVVLPGYPAPGSTISATADNAEEVYLNGTLVGSDGEVQGAYVDNAEWGTVIGYPIVPQSGSNSLDFITRNYACYYPTASGEFICGAVENPNPELNPTGLIYEATFNYYPQETAWGDGTAFPGKNWATYFAYTVQPSGSTFLKPGWDIFPPGDGTVEWTSYASGDLHVTFNISDGPANTTLDVGLLHTDIVQGVMLTGVDGGSFDFIGLGIGPYTRELRTVGPYNVWIFGEEFTTDGAGDGSVTVDLSAEGGDWDVQFFVLPDGTTTPAYESAGVFGTTVPVTVLP